MPKEKTKNRYCYYVDVPSAFGDHWETVTAFRTKELAIKFAKQKYGADNEGKINLITKVQVE